MGDIFFDCIFGYPYPPPSSKREGGWRLKAMKVAQKKARQGRPGKQGKVNKRSA